MTKIRNIAIIAHVDHGKTTLVDKLIKEAGVFRANQVMEERVMDNMDLEREKGITIKAKNASIRWHDCLINIVDTPGHADFGGEVERIMGMVDGVLLLVDAYDGPQAQTRFVLRKALEHHLKPIVVVNKIDREHANPEKVHDQVLELFLELNATEEQFNAPFLYASGRDGYAVRHIGDPREGMTPLFEAVIEHIPPPRADLGAPFRMQVANLDWNDYVGRIAVGRVLSGKVQTGDGAVLFRQDGRKLRGSVTKIFVFSGTGGFTEAAEGEAGTIIGLSGFEEVTIGETIGASEDVAPLPFIELDPPTIQMDLCVNDGPLAGRDGKFVTSRYLRDRLVKEVRTNISLALEEGDTAGAYRISARGLMQIAVLVEQMRREGFELCVSRPTVILRQVNGVKCEPFETLWLELPDDCMGGVIQNLAGRKGVMQNMQKHPHGSTVSLEFAIPTRGLIGFEADLANLTSGRGVMSHLFKDYEPYVGEFNTRQGSTLVSMDNGIATHYALENLQERGRLFIGPGEEVYVGMIVGDNPRPDDILVNPTKAKHLSNVRSQGEGKATQLEPPIRMSMERALEYIAGDEFVEVTPRFLRLRKKILDATRRNRAAFAAAKVAG
ncbi:MAG: translational GTPase TypA [Lentisphaeria bacterium]|jgi:GTP-binding protein